MNAEPSTLSLREQGWSITEVVERRAAAMFLHPEQRESRNSLMLCRASGPSPARLTACRIVQALASAFSGTLSSAVASTAMMSPFASNSP